MPGRAAFLADCRYYQLLARRKSIRITPRNPFASLLHGVALCQLHQADGRLKIRKVVLESRFQHFIKPRSISPIPFPSVAFNTMEAHETHALGSLQVIGGYHSTFAGCQRLGRIKTEAGELADLPHAFSPVLRRERVSGIFDDPQLMHSRERVDLVHFARLPA